jgi:hypothetical protein
MTKSLAMRGVMMAAAIAIWMSAALPAQDSNSSNSLGHVARQTRLQVAAASAAKAGKAPAPADKEKARQGQQPSPEATERTSAVPGSPDASDSQTPSLADLARQTRQTPHTSAQERRENSEENSAPAGFQSFVLPYCQNPQHCAQATVVVPENAEVVSRINGQHIFKATVDGEPVMLYAGPADVNAPYRSLTDPDYRRMRDLANANDWSREKADRISTQDMTIEGRTALLTRFRFQRDQKRWWIGQRVLIEGRVLSGDKSAQFLLGCAAPEEHFADAEALCTTMVNSLRLP